MFLCKRYKTQRSGRDQCVRGWLADADAVLLWLDKRSSGKDPGRIRLYTFTIPTKIGDNRAVFRHLRFTNGLARPSKLAFPTFWPMLSFTRVVRPLRAMVQCSFNLTSYIISHLTSRVCITRAVSAMNAFSSLRTPFRHISYCCITDKTKDELPTDYHPFGLVALDPRGGQDHDNATGKLVAVQT